MRTVILAVIAMVVIVAIVAGLLWALLLNLHF